MTLPGTAHGEGVAAVPKVIGADAELGNLVLGANDAGRETCREASRAILAEVEGVPARRRSGHWAHAARSSLRSGEPDDVRAEPDTELDWGRKFLRTNGAAVYIDLDHLELTTPETRSARDHVAAWHAMLRVARGALHRANSRLGNGQRIVALINNSDGKGHSYGSHLSISVSQAAWDDMFVQRLHPALFFLIAFQASSIVITGQGKVGAENGWSWVPYQISQRADFFMQIVGPETSYRRPLANSRDESHCLESMGAQGYVIAPPQTRLHCIFHDQTLCHVATYLKAGLMQIVVAMIEAGHTDRGLILRSPLEAVRTWSRDPTLSARSSLDDGRQVTAIELQRLFLDRASAFVATVDCSLIVPEAALILERWSDTLDLLERRDFDVLARRLDWVLKRRILERAMEAGRNLDWHSPEIAHLDQIYGSLDEKEGAYWACEGGGAVDRVVTDAEVHRFTREPPNDTRAWSRAMLLRAHADSDIEEIDWSYVRLSSQGSGQRSEPCTIWLPAPGWGGRPEHGLAPIVQRNTTGIGGRNGGP